MRRPSAVLSGAPFRQCYRTRSHIPLTILNAVTGIIIPNYIGIAVRWADAAFGIYGDFQALPHAFTFSGAIKPNITGFIDVIRVVQY